MKKIVGLDLGVSSIGWAIIEESDDHPGKILGMGSRIVPLDTDDKNEFSSGNTISKNQKRTEKRTQRKGYDRYQLRRSLLIQKLKEHHLLPGPELSGLDKLTLWKLRHDAAEKEISPTELGRVLLHLNQKRGYKSSRKDENASKKDTDYVMEVKTRYQELQTINKTIGQYFYLELLKDEHFRIKQRVYPREAYLEEFDRIIKIQKTFHEVLNDDLIHALRDEIIYYQRPLKSQKGLVSVCDFEGFVCKNGQTEKNTIAGPKVAPRSSPVAQICKIWESINNIVLKNKQGDTLEISLEDKKKIFEYLDHNEKLTQPELFKILQLKKDQGWYCNKQILKGLQGNLTKSKIIACFEQPNDFQDLLKFNVEIISTDQEVYCYDIKSGELKYSTTQKTVSPSIEKQPLYQLWHLIYSSIGKEQCKDVLVKKFNLPETIATKLASIDFTTAGFSNKSVKAMRKILPYLMEGYFYSDACMFAGYNHSGSKTKDENLQRVLLDRLPNLGKNSLRQPIVEKILNQMINLVNAIIGEYGRPDEIRVELARELKQSREERNDTYIRINKTERENLAIAKRLQEEYHIRPSRNNIIKWKLFHEIDGEESKANACCIYCGKPFGITAALSGSEVDIEHIIPKKLLFDDSQSNKTLSHRKCNQEKDNQTAYDYMKGKSEAEFRAYIERIDSMFKKGVINKTKRDKLLMPAEKIPQDFIDRQLRETQYISRKSREILAKICPEVWATSGSVTEYLRRIWGWNDVLMNLHLPIYRELGLTEMITLEDNGQSLKKEIIPGWSKRDDHRHHAIDALTIACTRQGYIQRINTLSSENTRNQMHEELKNQKYDKKKNLLENYIYAKRPFTTSQIEKAVSEILVSFKPGKRVATISKYKATGKNLTAGVIVPRGALSEESVYGKIKCLETKPLRYLFENPELIVKPKIKELVKNRLEQNGNDVKKALASLKKSPVYLDADQKIAINYGSCYREEFVMKYPLEQLKAKDLESIVDPKIRQLCKARLAASGNNDKTAFKDLAGDPLWLNRDKGIQVKTVRLYTGLKAAEPIKKDDTGKAVGFVKPANNHHIAIYRDSEGKLHEHVCTFWHAIERKKHHLPVIIDSTKEIWNEIINSSQDRFPLKFVEKLPPDNMTLVLCMQQNEMFILGLTDQEIFNSSELYNNEALNHFIYKVQNISEKQYRFCKHFETKYNITLANKEDRRFYNLQSIESLIKLNPRKVRLNILGKPII